MELQTRCHPENFSFGAPPVADGRAVWPDGPPSIALERVLVRKRRWWRRVEVEEFELARPIRYRDQTFETVVTVPAPGVPFRTDLTSVPAWLTWLVPKSGAHLPAALIHDGLVPDPGGPQTYATDDGRVIDRIDADRIFRDAMRDTGVGVIRRWLVWAAVTTASLAVGPRPEWRSWLRGYYWVVLLLTFGGIGYLGTSATVDLADRDVSWLWDLPWMLEGAWWQEAAGGLAGAIVIPIGLAVLWGRWFRAGAIAGVALASLLHVTVAVGVVAACYQAAELVAMKLPRVATALGLLVVVGAAVLFGRAVAG